MTHEAQAATLSIGATAGSFALNDVLQTLALLVAIVSGCLAIYAHFRKRPGIR
jgi:hypothetical protein